VPKVPSPDRFFTHRRRKDTLIVLAIPALVTGLRGKAERERDRVHPSR
jgi:hypothetical protein